MKKCNCSDNCGNDSKAMYSVDYDSVIEELISTRNKIDSLIHTLETRKSKDVLINSILSSEYEDEDDDKQAASPKRMSSNKYVPRYYHKPWYVYSFFEPY